MVGHLSQTPWFTFQPVLSVSHRMPARVCKGLQGKPLLHQQTTGELTSLSCLNCSCYKVTGGEGAEVWVRDPLASLVVEVHADVRTITTDSFATRYSLRFPRAQVRGTIELINS